MIPAERRVTKLNGFQQADKALEKGTMPGFHYLGCDHYVTNDNTANHVFARVKKLYHLGICRTTWGQISVIQNPAGASGGVLSGVGLHTRADFAFKAWNTVTPLFFDINVNYVVVNLLFPLLETGERSRRISLLYSFL